MAYLIPENLASNAKVPAAVQKVARAFRALTPDDVTVRYDLSDDDNLIVVLSPRHGVLVLSVLGHGARGLTKAMVDEASDTSAVEDQLWGRAGEYMGRIVNSPHLGREIPVMGVIAVPDADSKSAERLGLEPDDLLLRGDLTAGGLPKALDRLFEETVQITAKEERAVRGAMEPRIVIRDRIAEETSGTQIAFRAPVADDDDALAVLDREQQNLAQNLGAGYRVIRGVAGSGKSIVLSFRARWLAERFPQWSILVTCYNKVLSKALGHHLRDLSNVEVRTIDSLAYEVVRMRCKSPDDWIRQRAVATTKLRAEGGRYDVVLVDEGQDFDTGQFDLAWAALRQHREDPQFLVVLDAAQNIYRRGGRWNPPGMTAQGRTKLLRVNYRNTKEILELAYQMLSQGGQVTSEEAILDDPSVVVPPEATSRRGSRPMVRSLRDRDAEAAAVCDQLEKWSAEGTPWDDMLVIYGSGEHQRRVYAECTRREIPYFCVSRSSKTKGQVMQVVGKVRSSTVHSIKGLEFGHVAVCGVNGITTIGDEPEDEATRRRLLYVAMTRATDHLFCTVSGHDPLGQDLLRAAT